MRKPVSKQGGRHIRSTSDLDTEKQEGPQVASEVSVAFIFASVQWILSPQSSRYISKESSVFQVQWHSSSLSHLGQHGARICIGNLCQRSLSIWWFRSGKDDVSMCPQEVRKQNKASFDVWRLWEAVLAEEGVRVISLSPGPFAVSTRSSVLCSILPLLCDTQLGVSDLCKCWVHLVFLHSGSRLI